MERNISKKIQVRDTLNPLLLDYGDVPAIDDEANLRNLFSKFDKVGRFWKTGKTDESLARYIPSILPITIQNRIASSIPRKAFASVTYSDIKNLEFVLELTANTYSNYISMELVLPIHKKRNGKYPFAIFNTNKHNKSGAHWWNFIDIQKKKKFCYLIVLD